MAKFFLFFLGPFLSSVLLSQVSTENCEFARRKYLEINTDVAKAKMDPWSHYQAYGRREGRVWPSCESSQVKDMDLETAQTKPGYCELVGSIFHNNAIKYVGPCKNNTANGWGKLYLRDGNIATALFKDNKIQNEHIDLYRANRNDYVFGQNIGLLLNGPCMQVSYQNMVDLGNFSDGNWTGNGWDYFQIPKPDTSRVVGFCDTNGYNAKRGNLVPGTENVIYTSFKDYNSNGDNKYWITIVNLKSNKVVKTFGSWEKPLVINGNGPEFIGFALPNYAIYKYSDKLHQLDLTLGTNQVISAIPTDLNNSLQYKEKIKQTGYKDFVPTKKIKTKVEVLKDSSYVKIFNNDIYNESVFRNALKPVYGSGASIVKFNKNHEVVQSVDLSDVSIYDFAINEQLGRIALSYKSADSTFLSYVDLSSLKFIGKVFSKGNVEFDKYIKNPGDVRFSNSGAYLLYDRGRGTSIYLGNELYYGVSGVVYDFNNDENIIISNEEGQITAFDLEKKAIIWSFKVRDDFWNTGFFCLENEICIISGRPGKEGIRLNRFIMPEPMLSLTNFIKNNIYDAHKVGDTKKVDLVQSNIENSKTTSNQAASGVEKSYKNEMEEYLTLLFFNALLEGFSGGSDTQPNGQNNDQKCAWCGRIYSGKCYGAYKSPVDHSCGSKEYTICIGYENCCSSKCATEKCTYE